MASTLSRVSDWAGRSKLRAGLLIIVVGLLLIQLFPYGRDHSNPPVTRAVAFDTPRTEQLADDACSEWDRPQPDVGELAGVIQEGEMPPLQYRLLHPGSRLSDSEKADLIAGLTRTYRSDPPGGP